MRIDACLSATATALSQATDSALLEAQLLLAYVLQCERANLYARPEQLLTEDELSQMQALVARRLQGEPIAYLLGQKEFWSRSFKVTSSTLIPRPDTELLVETLLNLSLPTSGVTLAELGTGSGAVIVTLAKERPTWQCVATDISEAALAVAQHNAKALGVDTISFRQGNWCHALLGEKFDVIFSNPPYLSEEEWPEYAEGLLFEPRQALVSGEDGLEAIREIVSTAGSCLKPGGYLLIEHGFLQAAQVRVIFKAAGLLSIVSYFDINGKERVTLGQSR